MRMKYRNELRFNITFWLVYFMYEWLANASVADEYRRYLINASAIVPVTFLASVFTVHILFKKFYLKNRKKAFWIGLIVSMTVFVLARRGFNYYYVYPLYYPDAQLTMPYLFLPKMIIEAVNIYLIAGLYSVFYLIQAWYEEQRLAQALIQQKTEAELQVLKSQVQPHFIFNTLNNIYSYAIRQNEKTPDLLHRLSSFLSYNLYESKSPSIALSKELEYINSYLELEKIRYGSRLDVSVNVFSPVDDFHISPLLLLPLVENCFKHGSAATPVEKCWIRVDISRNKDWLTVKIENSIGAAKGTGNGKNGIGLENVRRRLEIIYPSNYDFRCIPGKDSYLAILKVKNLLRTASA